MIPPPPCSTLFPYTTLFRSCYLRYGLEKTVELLDGLKQLGFTYATRSGLSIGIDDLIIPAEKPVLVGRSEEHTSELQSLTNLVCRLLLEKKKGTTTQKLTRY